MRPQTLETPKQTKQDQMNITFGQDQKFLYEWINRKAKEINCTRAGFVKRMMMRDYQRVEVRGGRMIYPAIQVELQNIA